MASNVRVIALYLPQFHPVPDNDRWWGKGFTEWTNVGKARPLFRGHYQPHVPADLGYYDLRLPEAREAQADLAKAYGVEGFMYWHYWFGNGKRLLERPFQEVLKSGKPDFPFCLAWANESWKGFAHGLSNRNVLIEQQYPGDEDYTNHFYSVLPAFKDKRYITVDGKPVFMIYKPHLIPDPVHFIELWRLLAKQNGLKDIYFIAHHQSCREQGRPEEESFKYFIDKGFDAINYVRLSTFLEQRNLFQRGIAKWNKLFKGVPLVYPYRKVAKYFNSPLDSNLKVIPSIIPGWDHTPRSRREGFVLKNSTPSLFEEHVHSIFKSVKEKPLEHRIVFIKSWNEWAEGNYMEPDLKWGHGYLEALKRQLESDN